MGSSAPVPSTTSVSVGYITFVWIQSPTAFLSAGIRQLQLVLLKVALLLGVEVHVSVEFQKLVDPPEDQHRRSENGRH